MRTQPHKGYSTKAWNPPRNWVSPERIALATISGDGQYNFNYEIAGNRILQDGAYSTPNGFSIGDSQTSGYWLDSSDGTGLSYTGNNGLEAASGGTLTATPVPFEPNASIGIFTLGAMWGVNQWRKNLLKK